MHGNNTVWHCQIGDCVSANDNAPCLNSWGAAERMQDVQSAVITAWPDSRARPEVGGQAKAGLISSS